MVRLGELVVILDLHRQGLSLSAIARQTGLDRKTVRRYVERGLEPPTYQPRPPCVGKLVAFQTYLRDRVAAYPELTASRLHRELRDLGYGGGYTAVKVFLRGVRPDTPAGFEVRFETPPGRQAQVDFAHFRTVFTDEPGVERVVWLFSLVLGHSRMLWGRFVPQQDMQTVLRCHAAAFEALGGAPDRNPLRPDENRRRPRGAPGRSRCWPHRLQPDPGRVRPPLRLPAKGLQGLPGQDQGQGGAAVPLYPGGFLPRAQLPRPRRPQRPVPPMARPGRQHPHPRHHAPGGQRALRRGAALA